MKYTFVNIMWMSLLCTVNHLVGSTQNYHPHTHLPLAAAPCRSTDEPAGVLRRDELDDGGGGGPALAAAASASLPRSTHMPNCVIGDVM